MTNIVPMRINANEAKKRISLAAEISGRVFISKHAKDRMKQRRVTRRSILRCLSKGAFVEQPYWSQTHGNYHFSMQTMDAGEVVKVVAALGENEQGDYVLIVTVIGA